MSCAVFSQGSMNPLSVAHDADDDGIASRDRRVLSGLVRGHEDLDRDHRGPAVLGKVASTSAARVVIRFSAISCHHLDASLDCVDGSRMPGADGVRVRLQGLTERLVREGEELSSNPVRALFNDLRTTQGVVGVAQRILECQNVRLRRIISGALLT